MRGHLTRVVLIITWPFWTHITAKWMLHPKSDHQTTVEGGKTRKRTMAPSWGQISLCWPSKGRTVSRNHEWHRSDNDICIMHITTNSPKFTFTGIGKCDANSRLRDLDQDIGHFGLFLGNFRRTSNSSNVGWPKSGVNPLINTRVITREPRRVHHPSPCTVEDVPTANHPVRNMYCPCWLLICCSCCVADWVMGVSDRFRRRHCGPWVTSSPALTTRLSRCSTAEPWLTSPHCCNTRGRKSTR